MTIVSDGIDVRASDAERYRHLRRIIENVLADTDPTMSDARRRWLLWLFLYICWWEGSRATTRTQTGGGPGRGFMQFEPGTLVDLLRQYVLSRPAFIANLAAAAGVTEKDMGDALRAFDRAVGNTNVWPNPTAPGPARRIEEWLTTLDSFGVKLMRYEFKRHGRHRFPPKDPKDEGQNPQDERFKGEFSEQWADWWKKSFRGSSTESPEDERARQRRTFEERARMLDRTAADSTPPPPGPSPPSPPPPEPTPPAPVTPAPTTPATPPAPTPPGGTGPCPFVIALGPDSVEVARIRELRLLIAGWAAGRATIRTFDLVRPTLVEWVQSSPRALVVFRFAAGAAGQVAGASLLALTLQRSVPARRGRRLPGRGSGEGSQAT